MADATTRREFLAASAVTAAALVVAPALAQAPPALRLRKAVKYSMVNLPGSLTDQFKVLKEIGFEGIDMDKPADHAEVNKAQADSGLVVHGVVDYDHWKLPLSDAKPETRAAGVAGLQTALKDCHAYGGDTVLLVPAVVNKTTTYAEAYERSQAEIRKVLPLAAELKIKILIENVWNNFLLSPLELAKYIDEFNSPWIGSYFDVGNMIRYGWPEHWIQTLGNRIGKLDIKEYSRKLANTKGVWAGFEAEIGEGEDGCDWPAVLTALKAIGYSGWATAEVSGGNRDRLANISAKMDKIFTGYGS